MKTLKRNFFLIIVIAAMIAGVVFVLVTVPIFRVASGSMEPTLPVGSVVFEAPADALKPGTIITFQQDGDERPTTHTFIGYAEDGSLMTKGDANPTPDVHSAPLTPDDVIGKVVLTTPVLAPSFWLSQRGLLIATFGTLGLLFLWLSARVNKKEALQLERESHDASRELNPV